MYLFYGMPKGRSFGPLIPPKMCSIKEKKMDQFNFGDGTQSKIPTQVKEYKIIIIIK